MDITLQTNNEVVTCVIYTDPCTLECGHSFCRKCVTKYTKARPENVKSMTIPCAICEHVTSVSKPRSPVTEWARYLQPSPVIQRLMEDVRSGTKHKRGKNFCSICKEIGEITPASSLCSDCKATFCTRCVKKHLTDEPSKNHDVLNLSEAVKVKRRRKVKCEEHKGEAIRYICIDCNKTSCKTCLTKHSHCTNIVTTESMMPNIRADLTEKKHTLEKKIAETRERREEFEYKTGKLKESKIKARADIKSAMGSAISLARKKEKALSKEIFDELDKNISKRESKVREIQITNQSHQQYCEFIDLALQSESAEELYGMYKVCLHPTALKRTSYENWNIPVIGDVKFTPNLEPLKKALAEWGEVTFQETPLSGEGKKRDTDTLTVPVLHDTIDIKHSKDTNTPYPIDVTVLTVKGVTTLVVADFFNDSLKSVYLGENKKKISVLKLPSGPNRIAKMTENRIAAAVMDCHIVIAKVKPKLFLLSDIETDSQYEGTAALSNSTLVAGTCFPSVAVKILDLSGHILKCITSSCIEKPRDICTTRDDNILVSDLHSMSVYCLTSEGEVLFTYKPTEDQGVKLPRGIAVMKSGDILFGETKKIMMLTAEGTFVKDIVTSADGFDQMTGFCVDDADILYLCDTSEGSEHIKMFRLPSKQQSETE